MSTAFYSAASLTLGIPCYLTFSIWDFPKIGVPCFGALIIRVLPIWGVLH